MNNLQNDENIQRGKYTRDLAGRTNRERMQAGLPPIGFDGKPIVLHLMNQGNTVVEMLATTHNKYAAILHAPTEGEEK